MSGFDPPDGGGLPFFDLQRMLQGGGDPWAMASQIARAVANNGASEENVDPSARFAIDDLFRVAELQLAQAPVPALPADLRVESVNRTTWSDRSLTAYRPFLERFGEAFAAGPAPTADPADPLGMMLGQMFQMMGPNMVAASAGSLVGQLGAQALGSYDLPVPRPGSTVLLVPPAIDDAADAWEVPATELRLWLLVHELASHAVLSVPHVAKQLEALLIDFAAGFRFDAEAVLGDLGDLTDLSEIQRLSDQFSDPDAMLSAMRTPGQDLLVPQIDALVAAVLGAVDHAVDQICRPLVASHATIRANMDRRWVDTAPADRIMERLLGLEITEATLSRGRAFIAGLAERGGDDALRRLWADELDLPTAAEVNAPGLWLARTGIDGELPALDIEIPDDLSGLDDL